MAQGRARVMHRKAILRRQTLLLEMRISHDDSGCHRSPHSRVMESRVVNRKTLSFWSLMLTAALAVAGCNSRSHASSDQYPEQGKYVNQPYVGKMAADDGQWIMPAKDYGSLRYSTLDQINTENVKNLKVAWTFSTGLTNGHEAAPLVVNNTMYLVTPWPNTLYALDLTQP